MKLNFKNSFFIRTIKSQKRDILRLSLRSAIAAVITYGIIIHLRPEQAFLAILSSVLILDFHIGSTISGARNRVLATLLGSVLGLLSVWLLPHGWGTPIALFVTMLIMNAIASLKGEWRYGVVAAISISLGADSDALVISIDRLIAIGTGAGVGVLVSFIVMPHKAEVRARNYMRRALTYIGDRFTIVIHNTQSEDGKSTKEPRRKYQENMTAARQSAKQIKFYNTKNIWKCIEAIDKVYNSVVIVDRIAAKTKTEISGETSGIRNNVDEFMEIITTILDNISNSEFENEAGFEKMEAIISDIQHDIKFKDKNHETLNMQHTFLFAIGEILENLKITNEYFEKA